MTSSPVRIRCCSLPEHTASITMIADRAQCNAQYQSIPPTCAAIDSSAHAQRTPIARRFPSTPSPRRLQLLVGVALFVTASAFLARRAGVFEHTYYTRRFPVLPKLRDHLYFDLFRLYDSQINANKLQAYRGSLALDGFSRRAPGAFVRSRETSSTAPDFILDEMVPTRQCGPGMFCRARLIVQNKDGQVDVKAGYFIYPIGATDHAVDSMTKQRVGQTTSTQARGWATTLLDSVSNKLNEVNCSVTVETVAQAILNATAMVVSCPQTGNALCDASVPVMQCAPPTAGGLSKEDSKCASFVRSTGLGALSFSQLQEHCPIADSYFNRVAVSLPFCKAACASGGERTVLMDFFVQIGTIPDSPLDCMSALLPTAYNMMYPNIPACDGIGGTVDPYSNKFFYTLGNLHRGTVPDPLLKISEREGCMIVYVFFSKSNISSVEKFVEQSCNSNV